MKRTRVFGLMTLFCALTCAPLLQADNLQFSGSSLAGSGSFTFPQGTSPNTYLNVTDALIGSFLDSVGICTTACTVDNGSLNLDSGFQNGPVDATGTYHFSAGGDIEIFGGIASLGIADGTELLSASFLDNQTLQFTGGTGTFRGLLGSITLNPAISSQSAVSGTDTESLFQVSFNPGTSQYTGTIQQSTVTVSTSGSSPLPSPEPSSIMLVGFGILSLTQLRRRFLS